MMDKSYSYKMPDLKSGAPLAIGKVSVTVM